MSKASYSMKHGRKASLLEPVQFKEKKGKDEKKGKNIDDLKKEIEMDDHKISVEELCMRYGTDVINGLASAKAEQVLKQNGPNALTPPKQIPEWVKFLKQMTNGFAILLWCGSLFSFIAYFIEQSQDSGASKSNIFLGVVLALVVFVTGCFQYYQQGKSDKIMASFKKMLPQQATVFRDGTKQNLPAENLVLGDVVYVESGARIPADIRILKNSGLKVDNSSLTGEAEPLSRSPECTHNNPLETKNLAFFSTFAVEGSAIGMVVRTGDQYSYG